MKGTGSCRSSLARQVSLKTRSQSWIQKLLWGHGRNSERGAEKWAFVVRGVCPCPLLPSDLLLSALLARAAAASFCPVLLPLSGHVSLYSVWSHICLGELLRLNCVSPNTCVWGPVSNILECHCVWMVFKGMIKVKMRPSGWGPNPVWLCLYEGKGHVGTQGKGGHLQAKERSLRRNPAAGTLILDFLPPEWRENQFPALAHWQMLEAVFGARSGYSDKTSWTELMQQAASPVIPQAELPSDPWEPQAFSCWGIL